MDSIELSVVYYTQSRENHIFYITLCHNNRQNDNKEWINYKLYEEGN